MSTDRPTEKGETHGERANWEPQAGAAAAAAIQIRAATIDDVERIVEYNQRMAQETEGRTLAQDRLHAGVLAALQDPQACRYFVAEADGQVIGQAMITYEWSDWRNGRFWWIQSVYVDSSWRRRGVFRQLYQYLHSLAKQSPDSCGLRLYVEHENLVAQETYHKLGMKPTGYLILEEEWGS